MTDLTDRQREIFTLIYETARDRGSQPSIREIMTHFGMKSPNGVVGHLRLIAAKGYIARYFHKQYNLLILRRPDGSRFEGFQDKLIESLPKEQHEHFPSRQRTAQGIDAANGGNHEAIR